MILEINKYLSVPLEEIEISQIRASGPGGQNVNKVSSAVHLRFDIKNSSLPQSCKEKILSRSDRRITSDGTIIIKAQQFRTLEKNREDALQRLQNLIRESLKKERKRIPTKPSKAAREKRLTSKQHRSRRKSMRRKITGQDGYK